FDFAGWPRRELGNRSAPGAQQEDMSHPQPGTTQVLNLTKCGQTCNDLRSRLKRRTYEAQKFARRRLLSLLWLSDGPSNVVPNERSRIVPREAASDMSRRAK